MSVSPEDAEYEVRKSLAKAWTSFHMVSSKCCDFSSDAADYHRPERLADERGRPRRHEEVWRAGS